MHRLAENDLIYGNLFEVSTPILRDRYNSALELLHGRPTALERFRIDQSGFSPEIAEELDDPSYLNPQGCNRMFILLTVEQAYLPLLDATFSCSRDILKRFISDNREALFGLTARDAVFGELEDSVYKISNLADITSIKKIRVKVRTPRKLVTKAHRLARHIEEFERSDTTWNDDDRLQEIIDLAEAVGDVRTHPLVPQVLRYEHTDFHTSHLDGLYVFNATRKPTLIHCGGADDDVKAHTDRTTGFRHVPISDRKALAGFLIGDGLVERIHDRDDRESREILSEKLDLIALAHAGEEADADEIEHYDPVALRRYVQQTIDDLPEEFHDLQRVLRGIEQDGSAPAIEPEDPAFFYLYRSAKHKDRDLVNHLLARLTPLDCRQLFICNKERFYELYETWPDHRRTLVADYLARHYQGRQSEVWDHLYGHDPEVKGPWGKRK